MAGGGLREGRDAELHNDFFQIFGVERRTVARYEAHVAKLDNRSGFIDLFWPGVLLVEQKSAGRDLARAYEQAGEYVDALPEDQRPRYVLVSDFQTFELHDLDERETATFLLADLHAHIEKFGFILGVQRRTFRDQEPANIKAAELVGLLHDALAASGYQGQDLERFLVRVVFCLFADDTGIFEPRDIFLDFIETRTSEDGSDTGSRLAELFQVLNTPEAGRQTTLDEDLACFPYVNGALFERGSVLNHTGPEMFLRPPDLTAHPNATLSELYGPSCRPTCVERTKPSTAPWTASAGPAASPRSASASSICSCSMRKCAHHWKR